MSFAAAMAPAQAAIFAAMGVEATYQLGDAAAVPCTAILQESVQVLGESGAVIARRDVISLQLSEVPSPQQGALVTIGSAVYKLAARQVRDGFHERYTATKQP